MFEVRELIEAEDQVLAGLTFQGRGKQSGVETRKGTSGTFGRSEAARPCAGRHSPSREQALEAAGLSE